MRPAGRRRLVIATCVVAAAAVIVVMLPDLARMTGLIEAPRATRPGAQVAIGDDQLLNVVRRGRGPATVVLVHGLPGSAALMSPLADALVGRGYQTVTYDRLGWMHSSPRPAHVRANPTSNARELLALIDSLAMNVDVLVGFSYGGGVVQEALRLDHASARCAVLLASTGNPPSSDAPREAPATSAFTRILFSAPVMGWIMGLPPLARRAAEPSMQALFHPEPVHDPIRDELLATLAASADTWLRERRERHLGFGRYLPEQIGVPTLVLHGTDDVVVTPDIGRHLAAAIDGATLELIRGGGHGLPLTHPGEMAARIDGFAKRCTTPRR